MAELSKLEHRVLEALVDQHAETRRGTRTAIVKAACNARNGKERARVEDALLAMQKRGLVIGGPMGWVPTDEAAAALEGLAPAVKESLTTGAAGDGSGEALPAVEYPATVERLAPATLPMDLLHRCAAMQMTLMADARRRHEQGNDPEALAEMNWLAETGRQLLEVGCHA